MKAKTEQKMILVPAGTFECGSSLSPDEQPTMKVQVSAFLIDRAPVTNAEFRVFVEAGGYENPEYWTPAGWEHTQELGLSQPNYWDDPVWNADDVPVTGVSWWEALAYARFVGKTLPTETQWEYACRGSDGRTYPWGEEGLGCTHSTGQLRKSTSLEIGCNVTSKSRRRDWPIQGETTPGSSSSSAAAKRPPARSVPPRSAASTISQRACS